MKKRLIATISAIIAISCLMAWITWPDITRSKRQFNEIAPFGNLTVAYGINERRIVGNEVSYFTAVIGEIAWQSYGSTGIGIRFKNGNAYEFIPNENYFYWINQDSGVSSIAIDDAELLIDRFINVRHEGSDNNFEAPNDFLNNLRQLKEAQQAAPRNR